MNRVIWTRIIARLSLHSGRVSRPAQAFFPGFALGKTICDRHHSITANSELMIDHRSVPHVPVDFLPLEPRYHAGLFLRANNRLIRSQTARKAKNYL
jgi:hypothetical protein